MLSGSYDVCGVEAEAMCIVENVHFDPESSLYPRSPTSQAVKSLFSDSNPQLQS